MTTFTFNRGEPITVDLVISGTPSFDPAAATVVMKLKPATGSASSVPPKATASVATFAVTYTAESGSNPAFWRGTIDAPTSAALTARAYVADAEIVSGGNVVQVTDPVLIRLAESVTPA